MEITVLGAGVIGISTAYELACRGHKVTVIEQNSGPAQETSFGNAGLIATGHAFSWNSPNLISNVLKPNSNAKSAFKIKWSLSPELYKWGIKFLLNCSKKKFIEFSNSKRELCQYSHILLKKIIEKEYINCHYNTNGIYYLHRTNKGLNKSINKIKLFDGLFKRYRILNKKELSHPFMNNKFKGGLIFQEDGSGDCNLFTQLLEKKCKKLGVKFLYNSKVEHFKRINNKIDEITINHKVYKSNNFIISFGPYSSQFQKQLNLSIPIYPVKGYSITLPIIDEVNIPDKSGIDEDNFLAFSKFGSKMRITSRAEFSGFDKSLNSKVIEKLIVLTKNLFGNSLDYRNCIPWTGLRPITPKGTPYICATKIQNLYLNTGHGHLGWSMASGSAKIISDIIENKTPQINSDPFKI